MTQFISVNELQTLLLKYFSSDEVERHLDDTVLSSKEERNAFKQGMIWAGVIVAACCYPFEASLSDEDIEQIKKYYLNLSIYQNGKQFFSAEEVEKIIANERLYKSTEGIHQTEK